MIDLVPPKAVKYCHSMINNDQQWIDGNVRMTKVEALFMYAALSNLLGGFLGCKSDIVFIVIWSQ